MFTQVVSNEFIKCSMCDTTINLRMQLGFFDIPFHLNCPKCKTSIDGKIFLEDVEHYEVSVNNAYLVRDYDSIFYSVELSAEFPTRKIIKKNMETDRFEESPYMRSFQWYPDPLESQQLMKRAMIFADYYRTEWYELKSFFELFWNNQNHILYKKLNEELPKHQQLGVTKVANNLDACVCLHQLLITTTGISNILEKKSLSKYNEIGRKILTDKDNSLAYEEFAKKIADKFTPVERKAFNLIESFAKIYEQLIPVIMLKKANTFDRVDKENYGIMTANFEELTSFYAKSFEWILENIDFVIGLNNIAVRRDHNSFKKENRTFEDYLKVLKGNKKDWMNKEEPFSIPLQSLDTKKRNAIQHFDSEIDYVTQKIVFKDRDNVQSIYLIEFASLCVDNFELIFYILELVYSLRKIYYIKQNFIPHFKQFPDPDVVRNSPNSKKVGRNSLCPCGSGKKYKKCCLK